MSTIAPAVPFRPLSMRAAALDARFAAADAGPLPAGYGTGTAIFAHGVLGRVVAAFVRLVGWRGKVFSPDGSSLRNVISPFGVRAIKAAVRHDTSWVDGRDCVVLDYSRTSLVARWVRDEIREVEPGRYLGMVFLGRRKLPVRFFLDFNR
jgi:hypothetical protein